MNIKDIITTGAKELGVVVSDAQAESFKTYADELLRWNRKVNLTAISDPSGIASKHFLDSLALVPLLPEGPCRVADIGAGAGFPGLALKVVRPDIGLTLIEPARRKATFLRHVIRTLGLKGVGVTDSRVEELRDDPRARFDVIVSRAFREISTLTELAGPLLGPGGGFLLSMGPSWDGTVPAGWSIERLEEITIPYAEYSRRLVVIKRGG